MDLQSTLVDVDTDLPVARVPCITGTRVSSCVIRASSVRVASAISGQTLVDIIAAYTVAHIARVASATE